MYALDCRPLLLSKGGPKRGVKAEALKARAEVPGGVEME